MMVKERFRSEDIFFLLIDASRQQDEVRVCKGEDQVETRWSCAANFAMPLGPAQVFRSRTLQQVAMPVVICNLDQIGTELIKNIKQMFNIVRSTSTENYIIDVKCHPNTWEHVGTYMSHKTMTPLRQMTAVVGSSLSEPKVADAINLCCAVLVTSCAPATC
jgi:hypothetical protein